jgi:hypothetical protein
MRAAHGFSLFERSNQGVYDPALSARLKAMYAKGAAADQNDAYNSFAPGGATPAALLAEIGLTPRSSSHPQARPAGCPVSPRRT